jgi:putative pyruvate formate lyase activating enzyme
VIRAAACSLCPRRCGAQRSDGRVGVCGGGKSARVYRYGLHGGEEPPVSGTRGSGAVFFSGCTLSCLYCQNWPWSQEGRGEDCTVEGLAAIFARLRGDGAHNLNLVSPTPWLPLVQDALARVNAGADRVPVVYNTSGYENVEVLRECGGEGLADIYLTDLRYARAESARIGSGAGDYVTTARRALLEMWRQTGPLRLDENGVALSGTICRLLTLPGRAGEAVENLHWLADHVGPRLAVSVMAQYRPAWRALDRADEWNRSITRREYDRVRDAAETLGFDGWIQEYEEQPDDRLAGFRMPPGYSATV